MLNNLAYNSRGLNNYGSGVVEGSIKPVNPEEFNQTAPLPGNVCSEPVHLPGVQLGQGGLYEDPLTFPIPEPYPGLQIFEPAGPGIELSNVYRSKSDIFDSDDWELISTHTERSTRRGGRKQGVSIQRIYRNISTGEFAIRHTVLDDKGKVVDDHYRPFYKPRDGELAE